MKKKQNIIDKLKTIYHQKRGVYLNDSSVLKEIKINDDQVICTFYEIPGSMEINELRPVIEEQLFQCNWVNELEIKLAILPITKSKKPKGLSNVQKIIAVSSCKGGVGKSTIALNIATAFHLNGANVGLFDADIHGPSLPTLITPSSLGHTESDTYLPPFINHDIKLMSYGYIQESETQPAILRGPIASNVLKQLLLNTDWGNLDVLIIDCPPGTGDILLTITQELELDSAVIITTPHELSYVDVKKGIEMFKKVNVPIASIIENMSYFTDPNTNEKHAIFGKGRLIPTAKTYNISHWIELPINQALASYNNKKTPYLLTGTPDELSQYKSLANHLAWLSETSNEEPLMQIDHDNKTQTLTITHENHQQEIDFKLLRSECQCAYCVDEISREKKLDINKIDPNITISKCFNVGRYAIGIEWNEYNHIHHSMYPIETIIQMKTMDKTSK